MTDRRALLLLALMPACPPVNLDPIMTAGTTETSGAPGTTGAPTTTEPTEDAPPINDTSDATSDPDTSGSTGSTGDLSGADTTSGTTGADTTGADPTDPSTGGDGLCGPPCDELWVHDGDLAIGNPGDTAEFACLGEVTGEIQIVGVADAAALAGLRNLTTAKLIRIEWNEGLTDLSPLACLTEVPSLSIIDAPDLVDASLPNLQSGSVMLMNTGITAAPTFAPGFVVRDVTLRDNPALVDISSLADWDGGEDVTIDISGNAALTSLGGIMGPIDTSDDDLVQVQLIDLPALTSLAGLSPKVLRTLWLQDLPLVADLEPLAPLVSIRDLTLSNLPAVADLHGLHNLESVGTFILGDCVNMDADTPGMDELVDLSGLDSLGYVEALQLANNANLASLTGAPLLTTVESLDAIANPKLSPAAIAAFSAQTGGPMQCVGGWDACSCFEFLPW